MSGTGSTRWCGSSTGLPIPSFFPLTLVAPPSNSPPWRRWGIVPSLTSGPGPTPITRYVLISINGRHPISSFVADTKTAGDQDYVLPLGLLKDKTDKGVLWDVTKNFRGYRYNPSDKTIQAAAGAGPGGDLQDGEGTDWLNFRGQWGDRQWPTKKHGQYCLGSECHIVGGPTGKHAVFAGTSRGSSPLTRFARQVRWRRTWVVPPCVRTRKNAMLNPNCDAPRRSLRSDG